MKVKWEDRLASTSDVAGKLKWRRRKKREVKVCVSESRCGVRCKKSVTQICWAREEGGV